MIKRFYFKEPNKFENILSFRVYNFCKESLKRPLMYSKEFFYSKRIDLNNTVDNIFGDFKSNTRNEIRKSDNYEVTFNENIDRLTFVNIYNQGAENLKRPKINLNELETELKITGTTFEDNICSIHAYLINNNDSSMLLYSVLNYNSNIESKLLGYFNRFHHFEDIKYFKSCNFNFYDFGGYALETNDNKLKAINKFKDSFGGELIKYLNFNSPLVIFLRILIKTKNNIETKFRNK